MPACRTGLQLDFFRVKYQLNSRGVLTHQLLMHLGQCEHWDAVNGGVYNAPTPICMQGQACWDPNEARGAHVCVCVQARHRACMQLVGEIEVQGRAIDAARTNVERHYRFIHDAYGDFMRKYAPGM